MPQPTKVTVRPMTMADISTGMELKNRAGWNQLASDWRMILQTSQGGCFVAEIDEKQVGTITTITYPSGFSWLGMLLVAPEYRRRGIGTRLLKAAIVFAQKYGAVRLDARLAGEGLYRGLGFKAECTLVRMLRQKSKENISSTSIQTPLIPSLLPQIYLYDQPSFGANRGNILSSIYETAPYYAFYVMANAQTDPDTTLSGYCLGRPGFHNEQIGPIVANRIELAQELLISVLNVNLIKDFIIDVPTTQKEWINILRSYGFVIQLSYTRMQLGSPKPFKLSKKIYAIAGPELG